MLSLLSSRNPQLGREAEKEGERGGKYGKEICLERKHRAKKSNKV